LLSREQIRTGDDEFAGAVYPNLAGTAVTAITKITTVLAALY